MTLVPDYALGKKMRLPVHASDTWKDEYVAWLSIKHVCLPLSVSSPFQQLYNYSNLLRCYFMSTGKELPTFRRAVPSPLAWSVQEECLNCSRWTVWPWRWRHHITSQRRYPLTSLHRVNTQDFSLHQHWYDSLKPRMHTVFVLGSRYQLINAYRITYTGCPRS
jgi:hypothetical protein